MKRFTNIALGALMMAGTALGATLAMTSAADARVSVGIGFGAPGYYGGYDGGYYDEGYYDNPCADPRFRYYHPRYCGYGYGPAYYGPGFGGIWFTDSFGHRHWHEGREHWGGGGHWEGGGHWGGHHH